MSTTIYHHNDIWWALNIGYVESIIIIDHNFYERCVKIACMCIWQKDGAWCIVCVISAFLWNFTPFIESKKQQQTKRITNYKRQQTCSNLKKKTKQQKKNSFRLRNSRFSIGSIGHFVFYYLEIVFTYIDLNEIDYYRAVDQMSMQTISISTK